MSRMVTYRLNDSDDAFFSEHKLSFSSVVNDAIIMKRREIAGELRKTKQEIFRALRDDFLIFFFGAMCLGISYVVINFIVFILLNVLAIIGMGLGLILLIRELLFAKQQGA